MVKIKKRIFLLFTLIFITLLFSFNIAIAININTLFSSLLEYLFPPSPEIISAKIEPMKVEPSDWMEITVEARDKYGITSVIADMAGIEKVELKLIYGDEKNGVWKGSWFVHSVEVGKSYNATIIVKNEKGKISSASVEFHDDPVFCCRRMINITGSGGNWPYRIPINISNTGSTTLTDYQILVTLDTSTLISQGKMRSDCGDIRFTDSDGSTLLSYWLESGCNSADTKIWVKVPNIPANSNKTIYVYYGNPSATSQSSETATFVYGEVEALTTYTKSSWGTGVSNPEDTYNTYYHDNRNEIIYTFTDFYNGSSVYLVPIKVEQIKLERYEAPGRSLANYRIRYQLTTATAVGTSFTTTGWTLIWGPTTHTPSAGWNTYDVLDFYWTKDNLRLDLSRDDTAYTAGGGMYRRTGLTLAKMCTYWSDSARTWPFDGDCTQRDYAPAIRFVGLLRKYTSPEPTISIGNEETQPFALVTMNTQTLISQGKMRSDCGDVRFTDSRSFDAALWPRNFSYQLVSGCNSASTTFLVNVSALSPSIGTTFFMYYGNPGVTSISTSIPTLGYYTTTLLPEETWIRISGGSGESKLLIAGGGGNLKIK